MYNDRIIAHEMVHAVMADALGDNFYDLPTWFKEGTAELIHGADERVKNDVALSVGGIDDIALRAENLITVLWSWDSTPAVDMSKNYSAAYLAVKFLATVAESRGSSMADVMNDIKNGDGLDTAIYNSTGYVTTMAFGGGVGASLMDCYNNTMHTEPLMAAEVDTGSIGDSDYSGPSLDAHAVVPTGTYDETPTNFNIIFPAVEEPVAALEMQIGANYGQSMKVALTDVRTNELGIDSVDVRNNPSSSISKFDNAINTVSKSRSVLGALHNRLEYALSVNDQTAENLQSSEARIRDVDMAKEMMNFSKNNILNQAAQAMISQANQQPQGILQLLR